MEEQIKPCEPEVNNNYYSQVQEFEVSIKHLTKGVIVSVGCKSFAFTDIDTALKEVTEWYKDPKAKIEDYREYLK